MEWYSLALRTFCMYVIIFLVLRIMGKREIGKLSVLDLVISVMIAEIAVIEIEQVDDNLMHGIVPIVILLIIQIISAFLSMKSRKVRLLLDGKPTVVVANGEIYRDELKKQRYNLDDLMLQLRENGVTSISEIDFAILETSGKLSVIPKTNDDVVVGGSLSSENFDENEKLTNESAPKIIPPGFRYEMLPIPLIMDGKVQDENLDKINKTRFWLKNIIQEKGAHHFKEVLLCTIDHKERIYIDAGNNKK
ncbi:MAG TPA: DUF421 domain-containing protein [Candidatus Paenibacillus intestinavium]|nr:DUF421 domain-containing protein [Candidatus Paenibacillus intestinavium]